MSLKRIVLTFATTAGLFSLPLQTTSAQVSETPASDIERGVEAYGRGEYSRAYSLWAYHAYLGEPLAQTNLGALYYLGRGVKQSYERSAYWHRKSAVQNHPTGQLNLGECYEKGHGVTQNLKKALQLYELSAAQGEIKAVSAAARIRRQIGAKETRTPALNWTPQSDLEALQVSNAYADQSGFPIFYAAFPAQGFAEKAQKLGVYFLEPGSVTSFTYKRHRLTRAVVHKEFFRGQGTRKFRHMRLTYIMDCEQEIAGRKSSSITTDNAGAGLHIAVDDKSVDDVALETVKTASILGHLMKGVCQGKFMYDPR